MRVVLSTVFRGHMHALARYLHQREALIHLFSSYPRWKLTEEGLPQEIMSTTPWFLVPYMALSRYAQMPSWLEREFAHICLQNHERFVAKNLPACDIFHGLSCHNLSAGLKAQTRGGKYICDHGSSHLLYQDRILREESDIVGYPFQGIDPRVIEKESHEYTVADHIIVASQFAKRTFVENGISAEKISHIPYGVALSDFHRVPSNDDGVFRVVYLGALSMRKGVHYLAKAFAMANIPNSQLVLIGKTRPETKMLLAPVNNLNVICTEIIPRSEVLHWFTRSSVKVLASIEDGFGLVLLEAQACGLPLIATTNTGGPDCIDNGIEGFVVPIRSPEAIAEKLVYLYENPEHRLAMGEAGVKRVKAMGGWEEFGKQVMNLYESMLKN